MTRKLRTLTWKCKERKLCLSRTTCIPLLNIWFHYYTFLCYGKVLADHCNTIMSSYYSYCLGRWLMVMYYTGHCRGIFRTRMRSSNLQQRKATQTKLKDILTVISIHIDRLCLAVIISTILLHVFSNTWFPIHIT